MTNQEVWDIANRKRHWLTAEEFLAQVAAHREAKLKEPWTPVKPFQPGSFVRTYVLDRNFTFRPKAKAPVKPKLEVTP